MGNRKAQADIAPMIRGAFLRAAKRIERRGKSLSELIEDSLLKDPLNTLKVMASFNPRQSKLDISQKIEINEIISLVTERQQARLEKDITPVNGQDSDRIEAKPLISKEEGAG